MMNEWKHWSLMISCIFVNKTHAVLPVVYSEQTSKNNWFLHFLSEFFLLPSDPLWCCPLSPWWVTSVEGRSGQSWWWRCFVSVFSFQTLRTLTPSWRARAGLSWDTGCRPSCTAHFLPRRSQSWLCTGKNMRNLLFAQCSIKQWMAICNTDISAH